MPPTALTTDQASAAAVVGAPGIPGRATGKRRILVVDDDRLVLATLSYGLGQAGYDVIDADNGDDAILLAREQKPQLALLDIRMEGKSGFDVAAYLREYCQIPFMFLSAFADEATLQQVKALGAVAYLVKPLDIRQIVPVVEAAFADIARSAAEATFGSASSAGASTEVTASAAAAVASSAPAAPTASSASPAAPVRPDGAAAPRSASMAMSTEVAIAIGVLMHSHTLGRQAAFERLQRGARDEGRSVEAQAARLLDAVEMLAR